MEPLAARLLHSQRVLKDPEEERLFLKDPEEHSRTGQRGSKGENSSFFGGPEKQSFHHFDGFYSFSRSRTPIGR